MILLGERVDGRWRARYAVAIMADQPELEAQLHEIRIRQATAKERFRQEMAALPFAEKLKMLEKLRERDLAIAAAREQLKTLREQK
jgi:hypothetical protein